MPDGVHDGRLAQPAPARLVVAALRAWMAPHGGPHSGSQSGPRDGQRMLALAGVRPAGALGFELLISALSRKARRPLDVRQGEGAALGADEAVLLDLVAALQRGDTLSALGGLSEWLAAEDLAAALRGAQVFARQLAAAGVVLHAATAPWPTRLAAPHRSR